MQTMHTMLHVVNLICIDLLKFVQNFLLQTKDLSINGATKIVKDDTIITSIINTRIKVRPTKKSYCNTTIT